MLTFKIPKFYSVNSPRKDKQFHRESRERHRGQTERDKTWKVEATKGERRGEWRALKAKTIKPAGAGTFTAQY